MGVKGNSRTIVFNSFNSLNFFNSIIINYI